MALASPKASGSVAELSGFARTKDLDGYWLHRRIWPIDDPTADDVARQIADGFRRSQLVADAPGPGYDDSGEGLGYEGNFPPPADYWPKMLRADGTIIERDRHTPDQ